MEDPLLNKLAQAAELANLPIEKLQEYEANMRTIIDVIAERTYAEEQGEARGLAKGLMQGRDEGREEGREEKAQAIAAVMLKDGVEPALVAKYTGLTTEQLDALKDRP